METKRRRRHRSSHKSTWVPSEEEIRSAFLWVASQVNEAEDVVSSKLNAHLPNSEEVSSASDTYLKLKKHLVTLEFLLGAYEEYKNG